MSPSGADGKADLKHVCSRDNGDGAVRPQGFSISRSIALDVIGRRQCLC
jgi:hypothetical protein